MQVRVQVFIVLFSFWLSVFSEITVHDRNTTKNFSIESIKHDGIEYIVLSSLCNAIGYTVKQNAYTRQFICSRIDGNHIVKFIEENRFVVKGSEVIQLFSLPIFIDGTFCIPLESVSEIFSTEEIVMKLGINGDTLMILGQNVSASVIASAIVPPSKKGIQSVDCSVKQNGTLLTIQLSDSLPFDYMYYHPNLILNFFGGTVDTNMIKITEKTGIVRSVSSVQFKESAQISIMLSTNIEEPLFDYVQDIKTVMVSLRPMKKLPPVNKTKVQLPSPKSGIVVVLDPGHGGKDPGAIGHDNIMEKDVVLKIALNLRDYLKDKPGITVLLTRDKDVFVPLSERTMFANEKKADLFVSIHADAIPGNAKKKSSIKGYKIYFLSQAKNEEDKLVAMRENAVIELEDKPQNYSNLQNVLIDLAGNEFLRESQDLCILLDQKFTNSLKKKVVKLHLGVGQANFWVLNGAYMPSVLVEAGFLSHPEEAKLLADKNFQKSMASALGEAVLNFTKRYGAGQ